MGTIESLDGCVVECVHPDKVRLVTENAPAEAELLRVTSVFKLLGDPTRARLLYALLEAGELCVCDLAAAVGQKETVTSQHLRVLRAERTVRHRRDGRMVYYSLDDAHVRMLMDVALQHVAHEHD